MLNLKLLPDLENLPNMNLLAIAGPARTAGMEAQRLRVRLQLRQLLLRHLLPALPRLHQRQQVRLHLILPYQVLVNQW